MIWMWNESFQNDNYEENYIFEMTVQKIPLIKKAGGNFFY